MHRLTAAIPITLLLASACGEPVRPAQPVHALSVAPVVESKAPEGQPKTGCERRDDIPPKWLPDSHIAATADNRLVVMSEKQAVAALYEPNCRTWTLLPNPAQGHSGGAGVVELSSGDLLVAGGTRFEEAASELLPKGDAAWKSIAMPKNAGRYGRLFALSGDRALWIGDSMAVFDRAKLVWTNISEEPDHDREAIALGGDKVLLVGRGKPTLVIDANNGSFSKAPPFAPNQLSGCATRDGRVLLLAAGGATWFDIKTSSFRALATRDPKWDMNAEVHLLGDGTLLIVGAGAVEEHILDPTTERLSRRPAARNWGASVAMPDGRIAFDSMILRGTDGRYRTGMTVTTARELIALPSGKVLADDQHGTAEVAVDGSLTFASSYEAYPSSTVVIDEDNLLVGGRDQLLFRYRWRTGEVSKVPIPSKWRGSTPFALADAQTALVALHDDRDRPVVAWLDLRTNKLIVGDRMTDHPTEAMAVGAGSVLLFAETKSNDQQRFLLRPPSTALTPSTAAWPKDPAQATCSLGKGGVLALTGKELFKADHAVLYQLAGTSETLTDLGSFALLDAPRCTARPDGRAIVLADAGPPLSIDTQKKRIEPIDLKSTYLEKSNQVFTNAGLIAFMDGHLLAIRNSTRRGWEQLLLIAPVP